MRGYISRAALSAVESILQTTPLLSNSEIARRTGLDRSTVTRIRNGQPVLVREGNVSVSCVVECPPAAESAAAPAPPPPPQHHANARAGRLRADIDAIVGASRYPLVNPEAIVVDPHMRTRYDSGSGETKEVPGAPRTWLTETLRVEPVRDAAGRRFLFTGAQNDTPVHEAFWANLNAYAAHLGADLVVGPWTYETHWWGENNPMARAYDPAIADHLCFGQMAIGDQFIFCGEMNTLPTAAKPISDLVTYSRGRWAVFPHGKIQLKSVASTDPSVQAHQVMTTGAVTRPKVIPRKAGVKSIFHHVLGAVLVEFDQAGDIFCRQVIATDDGAFQDLDRRVADGQVTTGHRVRSLVCGDIHTRKLDPANTVATFGFDLAGEGLRSVDNVVDVLRPEFVFLHDVFDNESRNHHNVHDSAHSYEMAIRGRDSVAEEIGEAADFLARVRRPGLQAVVVESNHDLGLERYVREGRYRGDGANVRIGLDLESAYMRHREAVARALDAHESPPTFSLFEHAARAVRGGDLADVEWVHDGQSRLVDGVECGHHGFRGANGSKGSVEGFSRIGRKISIGDKHSPEINEGVYCAGAMNLRQGYNRGPSSWAVAHIVQYPNGKRAIITLQSGKWRAEKPRLRGRGIKAAVA